MLERQWRAMPAAAVPSAAALDLIRAAEVVDIHVESFVWTRVLGYDLGSRNGRGVFDARFYGQADVPRMRDGGMSGAVLSVATNPFRRAERRTAKALANLERLRAACDGAGAGDVTVVSDLRGWRAVRAAGGFPCFLAVQGGNAFATAADLGLVPDDVVSRITLVHLTDSRLGTTSSPLGGRRRRAALTPAGADFVAACNQRRILVDLAHSSRAGFWAALDVHDRALPPIVSHTGVWGAHRSWRNIDDDQIRAVADRGGVVGIMYHRGFLGRPSWRVGAEAIVAHLEHAIRVGGDDVAALGSDWDGMIVTPRDMPTAAELPVLVGHMLARGWTEERVRKVLGANYLRVMEAIRP